MGKFTGPGGRAFEAGEVAALHHFLATTYPEWRSGQAGFNALARICPSLAEKIRNSDDDPFHDDNRIEAFYDRIERELAGAR